MKTLKELKNMREEFAKNLDSDKKEDEIRIVVGMATCGISAGARPVFDTLKKEAEVKNLSNINVVQTGCIGMCVYEPIVEVYEPNKEKVTYTHVDAEKAKKIIDEFAERQRNRLKARL